VEAAGLHREAGARPEVDGDLAGRPGRRRRRRDPLLAAPVLEPAFEGSDLNFAGWAKKLTGKPTITVGSVGLSGDFIAGYSGEKAEPASLDRLEDALDRGDFDLVAVGRALLQDPEWVVKIRDGRHGELAAFDRSAMATLY
jgi:2,4-dienoyl-CoA reductase-like NADH-dependent reductase (Old Yellow Enzyme family)